MTDIDEINSLLSRELAGAPATASDADDAAKARMLGNVLRRATADAPAGTFTVRADEQPWEPFDEGIERKVLIPPGDDGLETALYRLELGAKLVSHDHTHRELCWVLEGELAVGDHVVHPGELHVAEAGCVHPEIHARRAALLLIHSQAYTGPASPGAA